MQLLKLKNYMISDVHQNEEGYCLSCYLILFSTNKLFFEVITLELGCMLWLGIITE